MTPAGKTDGGRWPRANHDLVPDSQRASVLDSLNRLAAGDLAARDEIVGLVSERMRQMAHRMLRRFPVVRRWNDTDDIVQAASVRLWRALEVTVPESQRGLAGLLATQIRRELLDLARKYSRPGSFAANYDSGGDMDAGNPQPNQDDPAFLTEQLSRWTRLHEAAANLPGEARELFGLAWYAGLRQDEIADILGVSLRTVKRRWEATKSLLRATFPDAYPD